MEKRRAGRPSKPEAEKRQQIGVRTSPELKARLEAVAGANGRSVAQEAEFRLTESFAMDDQLGGERTKAVLIQLAAEVARAEAETGRSWTEDLATFVAARIAIGAAVEKLPMPVPENFRKGQQMHFETKEMQRRLESMVATLAGFNVVVVAEKGHTNTLAGLLRQIDEQEGRAIIFQENDESDWIGFDGKEATSDEKELLQGKLIEARHFRDKVNENRAALQKMKAPMMDAVEAGRLLGHELIGMGDGA